MNRLEVKELAPYLPYDLRMVCEDGRSTKSLCGNDLDLLEDYPKFFDYIPLLRPLSSIDDEDSYLYRAFEELYYNYLEVDRDMYGSFSDCLDYLSFGYMDFCPKRIIDFLLEEHVDIFGLIPQGLAKEI